MRVHNFLSQSLLIVCIVFLSGCSRDYPHLEALWTDFQARLDVKRERYEEALQKYLDVIRRSPEQSGIHSNVGVLLNMVQKPEEARKSLQYSLELAEKQNDLEMQYNAHYNLGVFFGQQKNIDEALKSYQAALEIRPTSKEAKTNIELLIQEQQKQNQQQQNGKSEQEQDQQNESQNGQGQGQGNKQDDKNKDASEGDQEKKDEGQNKDQKEQKPQEGERESSARYKPRPFKGDQLSEGDVKKILGELRNQEQKIRANFDKKEKGKSGRNDKDW